MKSNILSIRVITSLLMMIAWPISHAGDIKTTVVTEFTFKGYTGSNKPFMLNLVCTPYEKVNKDIDIEKLMKITDGSVPSCMLTKLHLQLNSKDILIPSDFLKYLADIRGRHAGIYEAADKVFINIPGGDGSWSYVVRYYVMDGKFLYLEHRSTDKDGNNVITTKHIE